MASLVQDGIDGRVRLGSEVGDHDVLGVIVKEKPGLLPTECFGEWVEISHCRSTSFAVRYAPDERLEPFPQGRRAIEGGGTIVHGGTGNKIPIPRRSNVFIFIAL